MPNPQPQYGSLNRLIASVSWQNFPTLNVSAAFLNAEGIELSFEGEATTFLPAMAGAVTSPQPYQMCSLTINLVRTQPLANLYKKQFETNTLLGNCVVRPDTSGLQPYDLVNMALENVRPLRLNGQDAGWVVTSRGYYLVNQNLWA